MTRETAEFTTPRGTWSRLELSGDPFNLTASALEKGFLTLSGEQPEEVISALLSAEGKIPIVYLGEPGNLDATPVDSKTLWVFLTSGSTGKPKKVAHTLRAITRKVQTLENSDATWGFFTDITRMAGIQVVLEALSRGENLVIPDPEMPMGAKAEFLKKHGVTHLSATPSQFRQFLSVKGISSMPLVQITLGGEIADQKILDGLRLAFPKSNITHVYATTETGPVLAVSDGLAGFPESQLSKTTNRIVLSELNEVGVTGLEGGEIHWTGDLVEMNAGRFQFVGRNSDFINVGGAKVNPVIVESVVMTHSDVQDCLVTGRESSVLGQLVVAQVMLKRDNEAIADELRELCSAELPKHAVPRTFDVIDRLTHSVAGKKVREHR